MESRSFSGESSGIAALSSTSGSFSSSPDGRQSLQGGPSSGLRMSKLTFVDMAGADRLELSGAVGDTLVESQNINLSLNAFGEIAYVIPTAFTLFLYFLLFVIGDVLFALSKNALVRSKGSKSVQHVPYLNSKLTQLLKESLGGNSKTVLITTIHSTAEYSKVTETSLQYATWARAVKGRVLRNDLNMGDRWIQETDPEIIRLK